MTNRKCAHCQGSMIGRNKKAIYCMVQCKNQVNNAKRKKSK